MSFIHSAVAASILLAAPGAALALSSDGSQNVHRAGAPKSLAASLAQPDYSLEPEYGSVALTAGFTPDPYVIEMLAGGEVDANSALSRYAIGQGGDGRCRGNIAQAPDFRLHYEADGYLPLIIRAAAAFDTTLVVNGPDGTWYCDDDSGAGVQAMLQWDLPASGQYDIWVGAYSANNNYEPARIEISELLSGSNNGGGGALNFMLTAVHGVIDLASGFTPDPRIVNVFARGEVAVRNDLSTNAYAGDGRCRGYTGSAPDLSVRYTAGSIFPFVVRAIADFDTTLVINAPDGSWHCDDDSGDSVQAQLVFRQPATGRYDIWFGSYGSGRDGQRGRIEISEFE